MIKKLFILVFLSFALLFLNFNLGKAENIDKVPLGIITGENVNMRDKPEIKGKIIYQFLNGEVVFYENISQNETQIGNDVYKWYKVKTQYPWRKKCIKREWEKVYKNNPIRLEGWVYGKYLKLFEGDLKKEDRILKEIINHIYNAQFINLTILFYNPSLQIRNLGKKEYYVFTKQSQDYSDDCQNYDISRIYIKDYKSNKYRELRGISGNIAPFKFYDLDNDGYAEIFITGSNKGLTLYSEKKDKDIFSINFSLDLKGEDFSKYYKNSYVELVQAQTSDKLEIIAHWVNEKKEVVKKVVYKWNGDTFVEDKK